MDFSKNKHIILQIGFWALIWLSLPYFIFGSEVTQVMYKHSISIFIGAVCIILINTRFLFPQLYKKKKFGIYTISTICTIVLLGFLIREFFLMINNGETFHPFRGNEVEIRKELFERIALFKLAMPILLTTLISTVIEIGMLASQNAQETIQLKSEKLETELKFLKSQINPHFLFNALNNIYTLTVIEPKIAGQNLLKLSEMLRYLLYECDAEKVSINKEMTYLHNYIDLFILKDEEALNVTFDYKNINQALMIAPLLLTPFVENAFKHSHIEDLENGWINIQLSSVENTILFEVTNSLPETQITKDGVGGIGLQNVKRQLELLYPNKYYLKINSEKGKFAIQLEIEVE